MSFRHAEWCACPDCGHTFFSLKEFDVHLVREEGEPVRCLTISEMLEGRWQLDPAGRWIAWFLWRRTPPTQKVVRNRRKRSGARP